MALFAEASPLFPALPTRFVLSVPENLPLRYSDIAQFTDSGGALCLPQPWPARHPRSRTCSVACPHSPLSSTAFARGMIFGLMCSLFTWFFVSVLYSFSSSFLYFVSVIHSCHLYLKTNTHSHTSLAEKICVVKRNKR